MAKKPDTVAVLMGGTSSEREVSLRSGAAVASALREAGYRVHALDVQGDALELPDDVEAVFIALHGTFGEDGTVQRMLRDRGMPYTGSSVEVSALCFDKDASKQVLKRHDLPTPEWVALRAPCAVSPLSYPVVVKPSCQGSSVGIHCLDDAGCWESAVQDAFRFDRVVLVEAYIAGRELTVGMVDGHVLPVLEIVPAKGYYDYEAKYVSGTTRYWVPAPVDAEVAERAKALARDACAVLGCEGMARVDFRLSSEGEIYILEVNTIPGFTATSLLPKAAAADGIAFPALCDRILRAARVH